MGGQERKQMGLFQVAQNNQTFLETMRGYARMICRKNGSVTSDDLREKARDLDIEPTHPNAWGAVFKGGDWVVLGFEPSNWPSNHGRPIRRWTLPEMAA